MKPKILSIDYDFFQEATATEQVLLYPDGRDYANENLRNFIWEMRYKNTPPLSKIKTNQKLLSDIKTILLNQNKGIPVVIKNSHMFAYQVAMLLHEATQMMSDVYNIDMHHDMFTEGFMPDKVDCGNWLLTAKEEKHVKHITWLARTASKDLCSDEKTQPDEIFYDTLDPIKTMKFDTIFLCRSDMWSPPHLDKYFHQLITLCKKHFNNIDIEKAVEQPRPKSVYTTI